MTNAVLGLLRGDALLKDPDARADEVMELGPKTTRPSEPLDELLRSNEAVGVKHFTVNRRVPGDDVERGTAEASTREQADDGRRAVAPELSLLRGHGRARRREVRGLGLEDQSPMTRDLQRVRGAYAGWMLGPLDAGRGISGKER